MLARVLRKGPWAGLSRSKIANTTRGGITATVAPRRGSLRSKSSATVGTAAFPSEGDNIDDDISGKVNQYEPYNWSDPFRLSDQLTEDERMVQEAARAYCQERLMPRILMANRHEEFDRG